MVAALLGSLKGRRERGEGAAVVPRCAPVRAGAAIPTLTAWHWCPMPRILKDPEGWTFSSFMKTLMPTTLERGRLSRTGETTWKGFCPPTGWAAMA